MQRPSDLIDPGTIELRQICHRPSHTQNAIVPTEREGAALEGSIEWSAHRRSQSECPLTQTGPRRFCIASPPHTHPPMGSSLSGRSDAFSSLRRRHRWRMIAHRSRCRDTTHLQIDVETVAKRSGQARGVSPDRHGWADALRAADTVVPARTGVHREQQLESRGKRGGESRPMHLDRPGFERLSERIECDPGELGSLVQEQHTAVGTCDRSRSRRARAPSDQRCDRRAVMRRLDRREHIERCDGLSAE